MIPRKPYTETERAFLDILMSDIMEIDEYESIRMLDEKKGAVELSKGRMKRRGLNQKIKARLAKKSAAPVAWRTINGRRVPLMPDGSFGGSKQFQKAIPDDAEKSIVKAILKKELSDPKSDSKDRTRNKKVAKALNIPDEVIKNQERKRRKKLKNTKLEKKKAKAKRAINKAAEDPSPENIKSVKDAAKDLGKSLRRSFDKKVETAKAAMTKEYTPFDDAIAGIGGLLKKAVGNIFNKMVGPVCKEDIESLGDIKIVFLEGLLDGYEGRESNINQFYNACDTLINRKKRRN